MTEKKDSAKQESKAEKVAATEPVETAPKAGPKSEDAPKAGESAKAKTKAAKSEAKKVVKDAYYRVSGGKVGNPPEKARWDRERR